MTDDDYPRVRITKEILVEGGAVVYKPDLQNSHFDPTMDLEKLPWGSVGIYVGMGSGWEQFVNGHEPVNVLFGATGVTTVYMDELEVLG